MAAESKSFDEVKSAEFAAIAKECTRLSLKDQAISKDLFGVAFSGGGIRSATFNLGVLQGLAEAKLLERAAISGAGYLPGFGAATAKSKTSRRRCAARRVATHRKQSP